MSNDPTCSVNLKGELDAFSSQFQQNTPKDVLETFAKKTQELAESGVVEKALKKGDKAPPFILPDTNGKEISLQELLEKGPVVLTFYRGQWCPFCNITVRALQKFLPKFEEKGATLVAISPELPDYTTKMANEAELTFPVLSDVGMEVGKQYGVDFVLDEKLQKIYMEFGLDVPTHNGNKSFQLPLPATYVIDKDRTVKYAFVDADYMKRAEPEEVLKAIP